MSRLLVPLTVAATVAAGPALACSCGPPNPKRTAARIDLLVEGSVVDQRPGLDLAGRAASVIRVRVRQVIRGHVPRSGIVTLHSAPSPAACGVDYRGGFTGRFGATMHTGGLYTSSCVQFDLNADRHRRPPAR